ncbi:hypothetical protein IAG41_22805 [Sphingomonas sp. JC676]|uniref:hypothetical protein n=1 Tax=Sphingomonas sp. JC676 TaxID=2768065 RepID=UPI001657AB90|nr:hypothetical protein [Sphingomonas sp. JC676]MBC9035231.1 hypothetical protein [Sphingomonas sp. JC676]
MLFGWLLVSGFRTGTMEFPQAGFTLSGRRSRQPVRFWLTALFVAILTILCALGTIGQIFFPYGL